VIRPTPEMVKKKFDERWAEFKPEERCAFRQTFIVHDYEVFPNKTLLCVLDIANGTYRFLWGCDIIRAYLRQHIICNDSVVFTGFNNKNFDNKISDIILSGANERAVKNLSDRLIGGATNIRWSSGDFGKFRPSWVGNTFDIGFDIGQKKIGPEGNERKIPEVGLKRWQRLNDLEVYHCSIPFDKPLRKKDEPEVERYCLYDCCSTAWLLLSDEAWNPCVNARRVLVDDYGDRGVNWVMTKPRITSIVLNASKDNYPVPSNWEDEHFTIPDTVRIWKNRDVVKAYSENCYGKLRDMSSKKGGGEGVVLKDICGIPHTFGVGGVHGCPKGIWQSYGGGIYSLDAASLYPNMMRHYGYLSRCVTGDDRQRFGDLIDLRVNVYKPAGDKRADGLKLVLNGGFGAMGFEKSDMYDPVHFCSVTILGQLLMTDLLEKLERHIELIQSNTDGIFFRLRHNTPEALAQCRLIVAAYEKRTKLEMEWTAFENLHQKDISNYVAQGMPKPGKPTGTGKIKKKGAWFGVKHCTATPYLISMRVHAALHDGELLSPEGIPLDRFAIEIKRDKNSECFSVDGKPDYRGWLDVIPVLQNSNKKQHVEVICKDDGTLADSLFGDLGNDLSFRKRRKATNCPDHAGLLENVGSSDIDLGWYKRNSESAVETEDNEGDLFDE